VAFDEHGHSYQMLPDDVAGDLRCVQMQAEGGREKPAVYDSQFGALRYSEAGRKSVIPGKGD